MDIYFVLFNTHSIGFTNINYELIRNWIKLHKIKHLLQYIELIIY